MADLLTTTITGNVAITDTITSGTLGPAVTGKTSTSAVASGTLAAGDPVFLNSDGTVSKLSTTAQVLGTPGQFTSNDAWYPNISYDANAQKVVVFYPDNSNSQRCTAVVGLSLIHI